jgi:hypothetical protein
MRSIKFRAWNKKWHLFGYLNLVPGSFDQKSLGNSEMLEPWQQFTGLLDSAGREVYEGDILSSGLPTTQLAEVVWDLPHACFCVRYEPLRIEASLGSLSVFAGVNEGRVTVVGNVHETPDLLKAQP